MVLMPASVEWTWPRFRAVHPPTELAGRLLPPSMRSITLPHAVVFFNLGMT
jgi:hypothetical protein